LSEYDFKTREELIEAGQGWSIRPGEKGGLSVFLRDGDAVLHTYSDYGAMIGMSCGTDLYLAPTPFGRQHVCSTSLSVSVAASLAVSVCATAETAPGGAGRGLLFMVSSGCSFS
jgi:hypothetical protein